MSMTCNDGRIQHSAFAKVEKYPPETDKLSIRIKSSFLKLFSSRGT